MVRFLDGSEPGRDGVLRLCHRAIELRAGGVPRRADGMRLAAVFLNPSLRTRTSIESACAALGIHPIALSPGSDSWAMEFADGAVMDQGKAEHVKDAVGVLSQFVDLLAVRAFAGLVDREEDRKDPVLAAFCKYSDKPVINLESALWHPLQGLADTATWMSRMGEVRNKRITLTWAPHVRTLPAAVPNQVLLSSALVGMDVTVAHPPGFDLDPRIVERATAVATKAGGSVRITHDQADAMRGAQVVYAKNWSGFSGYGRRDDEAAVRATLGAWQVTPDTMASTDGAGFMHCLPVRRNVVVADAVIDGPDSWVMEEAGLRLWTAMALLEHLGAGGTFGTENS